MIQNSEITQCQLTENASKISMPKSVIYVLNSQTTYRLTFLIKDSYIVRFFVITINVNN